MPAMLNRMKDDIKSIFARDPAARNTLDVLTNYPGQPSWWKTSDICRTRSVYRSWNCWVLESEHCEGTWSNLTKSLQEKSGSTHRSSSKWHRTTGQEDTNWSWRKGEQIYWWETSFSATGLSTLGTACLKKWQLQRPPMPSKTSWTDIGLQCTIPEPITMDPIPDMSTQIDLV